MFDWSPEWMGLIQTSKTRFWNVQELKKKKRYMAPVYRQRSIVHV